MKIPFYMRLNLMLRDLEGLRVILFHNRLCDNVCIKVQKVRCYRRDTVLIIMIMNKDAFNLVNC